MPWMFLGGEGWKPLVGSGTEVCSLSLDNVLPRVARVLVIMELDMEKEHCATPDVPCRSTSHRENSVECSDTTEDTTISCVLPSTDCVSIGS